jgi:hypothetical protein
VIQVIVAKQMQLPAHWIVQRMRAGVAPMAVEVVRGTRGSGTGQFEQLLARFERNAGGQYLGFGHCHRCTCASFGIDRMSRGNRIERAPRLLQYLMGRVQVDLQTADIRDDVGSSVACSRPESTHGRARSRTKLSVSSTAACAMP